MFLPLKISYSLYFRTQETGSHYQVTDRKLFQLNVHRWKGILLVFQLREKKVVNNMYILRLIHPSDLKLMLQNFPVKSHYTSFRVIIWCFMKTVSFISAGILDHPFMTQESLLKFSSKNQLCPPKVWSLFYNKLMTLTFQYLPLGS